MVWCVHVQSCLTLCGPMDCNLPGSSIHGIFQARILEWAAIPSLGDPPDPGIVSFIGRLYHCVTWEVQHLCILLPITESSWPWHLQIIISVNDFLWSQSHFAYSLYEQLFWIVFSHFDYYIV